MSLNQKVRSHVWKHYNGRHYNGRRIKKHSGISKSELTLNHIRGHSSIHIPVSSVKSHYGDHFIPDQRQIHAVREGRRSTSGPVGCTQEKGEAATEVDTADTGSHSRDPQTRPQQ